MKKFTELTHEELIALSESEITHYVDYECAVQGVKPIEPPEEPQPMPEETYYQGFWIAGIITNNMGAAEVIQSCLKAQKDSLVGMESYHLSETESPREIDLDLIQTTKIPRKLSKVDQERKAALLPLWDEYRAQKQAWDEYQKQRAAITKRLETVVITACNKQLTIGYLQRQCAHYLNLSEGNATIALKFFLDALETEYKEVSDLFNPGDYMSSLLPQKEEKS